MANVVFDFGGVVFRWQPAVLMREALPHLLEGAPDDAALGLAGQVFQSFSQDADWAQFDLGGIEPGPLAERIARRTGLQRQDVARVIDAIPAHLSPVPGTVALMDSLRGQGHRLFYLSNMPEPYALRLERHPFFEWFDDGLFSCRVKLIKPQADIFREAERRFGVAPEDTVFIDDVAHNIEAARAHGWGGVRFQDPEQCAVDLAHWLSAR